MTSSSRPKRAMPARPTRTSNRTTPGTTTQGRGTRVRRFDSPAQRRSDLRRARDHHQRVASIAGRHVDPRPHGPGAIQARAHQRSIRARQHRCRPRGRILLRRLSLHLMVVRPAWPLRQAPSCLQHLRCESTRGYHARTEAISCAKAAARTRNVQARPPRVVRDRCSGRRAPSSAGAAAGQAGRA